MTTNSVTIHSAPRDADRLQAYGPYMLRNLAQNATKALMGRDWTDQEKQAFTVAPINKRTEDVLQMLQQLDSRGDVPPPMATTVAAPVDAPVAAAPAPVAAPAARRSPTPASQMQNGTNGSAAAPDGMAVLADMSNILKGVSESLQNVAGAVGDINKNSKEIAVIKKDVATLASKMEQIFKAQHLTIAILAQIAENATGARFDQILDTVASDYGQQQPLVDNLISGK